MDKKIGIIIISHGSRVRNADKVVHGLIKTIKASMGIRNVIPSYLQFSQFNLSNGVKILVNKNCEKIIIVPFFLLNGQHVTRDIPRVIKKEKTRYPKVKFVCTGNLGKDKRITDIVIDRINESRTF